MAGAEIAPDRATPARDGYGQVISPKRLRDAMARLTPDRVGITTLGVKGKRLKADWDEQHLEYLLTQ